MKLVSCTIENFGGLHQQHFDFNEGLTVIEQPNGSGKTTLAIFVRCMLYGMPRQNKRDLNKDLRRYYAPWQGGVYGGQLVVQAAGRLYRIERQFGTAPKDDKFAVYDHVSGKSTNDLGAVPGITLFGVDVDSFDRSAYIPQNQLGSTLATSDIKAKLGNLVDNTDKTRNFETAVKALTTERAHFVPYRGQGGVHASVVAKISRISQEIEQLSTAQGEQERVRDRDARLAQTEKQQEQELEQVRKDITEAADLQARRGMALECRRLDEACKQAKSAYQSYAETHGSNVPSERDIRRASEALQCLDLVQKAGISQQNIAEFAARNEQNATNDVSVHHTDSAHANNAFSESSYADNMRTDSAHTQDGSTKDALPQRANVVLLALGAFLLVVGALLALAQGANLAHLFVNQLAVGVVVAVLGAGLCVAGAVLQSRNKKRAYEAALAAERNAARARAAEQEEHRKDLLRRGAAAQKDLEHFCHTYQVNAHALSPATLERLNSNAKELQRLQQNAATAEQAFTQFVQANGLCSWTRANEERFTLLNMQELRSKEQRLNAAREESLQNRIKDSQRMQALNERIEKIPVLQDELQTLVAQRKKIERDVETLDATKKYLEQAKEQLCEQYAGPVQERFQYYFRILSSQTKVLDAQKSHIDSDFHLTFSQAGATRSQENLSAGYADLVMVCMRMALCDALFEEEQPFIIMDDPFINIDDNLMQRAGQLLQKLAENHQIIYFTCSRSRRLFMA